MNDKLLIVYDSEAAGRNPIVFTKRMREPIEVYDAIEEFAKNEGVSMDADTIGELGDDVIDIGYTWHAEHWLFSAVEI